jgi:hypothetical protein
MQYVNSAFSTLCLKWQRTLTFIIFCSLKFMISWSRAKEVSLCPCNSVNSVMLESKNAKVMDLFSYSPLPLSSYACTEGNRTMCLIYVCCIVPAFSCMLRPIGWCSAACVFSKAAASCFCLGDWWLQFIHKLNMVWNCLKKNIQMTSWDRMVASLNSQAFTSYTEEAQGSRYPSRRADLKRKGCG